MGPAELLPILVGGALCVIAALWLVVGTGVGERIRARAAAQGCRADRSDARDRDLGSPAEASAGGELIGVIEMLLVLAVVAVACRLALDPPPPAVRRSSRPRAAAPRGPDDVEPVVRGLLYPGPHRAEHR